MGNLLAKFEFLDAEGKQQLLDYLERLLSKKKRKTRFDDKAYREGLLKVSV